jgi:hypothetical protein
MADIIRGNYPRNAAFILQEKERLTGNHASLMFWADRSVYSLEMLGWRKLSLEYAAQKVRDGGGTPYLLSDVQMPALEPALRSFPGYWMYELPPTSGESPAASP